MFFKMYKKRSLAICLFSFCFATQAPAIPLIIPQGQAEPILMIDGNQDGNDIFVDVATVDTSDLWNFGFFDTNGSFQSVIEGTGDFGLYQFVGGDIADFAIVRTDGSLTRRLSTGNATLVFTGNVSADKSRNPQVDFDYWQGLTISWGAGYNTDFVTNLASRNDGFAPLSLAISEPSVLILSGGGLCFLLTILFLRRRRRNTMVGS